MLSVDLLRYPFSGEHARDALAVCAVCSLAAAVALRVGVAAYPGVLALPLGLVAVVALVALAGYLGRVLTASVEGDDDLPAVGTGRDLLALGGRLALVGGAYAAVPAVVLLVTIRGTALVEGGTGPADGLVVAGGATVTLLVALGGLYLLPAAAASVALEGRVRAGFSLPSRDVLGHGAYFVAWVGAFTAGVLWWGAFATAAGAASVGGLLAIAVGVYAGIVGARMAGLGYARATGKRY